MLGRTGGRVRVAAGLWLLLDVLRMWTPSLITIFGRAAETPAELIGAFALAVCAVPLVLTFVTRGGERVALLVLVLARLGLFLTDGDKPQLVLASIGTAAGIWWLALTLGRSASALAPGLALGLLLDTATHAALGTYGDVWRHDVWAVLVLVVQVGLLLVGHRSQMDEQPGRTAAWLVFPVLLLLAGVLFANAGRASATVGDLGPALAVVGCVLAVLACTLPPRRVTSVLAGVVLAAVTATGLTTPLDGWGSPVWSVPPFVLGLPATFVLLSGAVRAELEPGVQRAGPRTVAAGAVGWVLLLFVYYAGYDLGYRADVVVVALAIMGVGMGMRAAPDATFGPWPRPARSTYVVGVLAVVPVLLLALVGPAVTLRPLAHPKPTATLHVAAWNLRMGYGIDGRFDARAVASTLLREHVDVALVSEIDRGWLLNGGQDQLRILARLTGMHVAFGAAADPVWGDAILSRHPLRDVDSHPFPSYGAVTGAEVLRARFDWNGSAVTVLSTHLQPGAGGTNDTVAQATGLARLIRRDTELGPVIAGGDLNTEPGSRAWSALLGARLTDALASVRPLLTSSADDPSEQIDHLFVSPELTTSRPRTLTSELSDHLPVLLDVRVPNG